MDSDFGRKLASERGAYVTDVRMKSTGRRIVIYGAGDYGRKLAKYLAEQGIEVSGFAVTQTAYNQEICCGLPVRAFSKLTEERDGILFLVGVKDALRGTIEKTLQEAGATYLLPPRHFAEMIDDCFLRPAMEITPRAGCSVHCRYCPQNLFLQRYFSEDRQAEMTFEEFCGYLDKLPRDTVIDFSGFVEPFLAKDGARMVRYAHESGHDVRLFTTLVGLDLDEFHEIEDIPFKLVVLHLPDVHHYANIPVTDAYLELLRYVVAKQRSNGDSFVDQANCQAEPNPHVVDIIGRQFPITWDMVDRAGNLSDEHLRSAGVVTGPLYCSRTTRMNHNVLLPNGDVVLCCMDFGMQRVLGNLKRQSYEEIMNGEVHQSIRAANHAQGDALCRHCTYARHMEA